jgi:putative sigma-54 modulation protein
MKIEITGRHIEVTPAIRTHVEDQFQKIEHLFNGKPAKAHVIIEVERGRSRAEIIINWRNEALTAISRTSDMYQALSQSVAKIETQARRLKDKVTDKTQKATKAAAVSTRVGQVKAAPSSPRIIEADGVSAKPMTVEEAALELESGKQTFVAFRNANGRGMSVLYRREDGNYGLIQP